MDETSPPTPGYHETLALQPSTTQLEGTIGPQETTLSSGVSRDARQSLGLYADP